MVASVYLADLRHNYDGVVAADCMPIGVGYMKAVIDRDLAEVESQVFAYPEQLLEAMEEHPPDVLMLSNYVWNEALSLHFAELGKRVKPDMLVVMGGPNIPVEPERQIEFFTRRPHIDLYALGEGDFLAAEIVRHLLAVDKSLSDLGTREIPSSIYYGRDGQVVRSEPKPRRRAIDDIPSPWLTGIMDEFFDGKLAPMIETNRGCPFSCSFCVQGTKFYTKINNFSMDRLREEIDYIGAHIKKLSPAVGMLRIADANYGMYERDVTISEYIAEGQTKYGWPMFIDATTGKNRPDRIIRSMEKLNGALMLGQSVQSLDENVLRNVRRTNITVSAYETIQADARKRGLRSNSDLILGLPGESLETHVSGLRKLVDAGTGQMHCFQAMCLMGSDMETIETRTKFKMDTRFRVLPRNYGMYGGSTVVDTEEIVVATDTMSFEDYLEARRLHVACSVFWNDGWFTDLVRFLEVCSIKPSAWLLALVEAMKADEGTLGEFLKDFVRVTREELFPTRKACAEFYNREDNFRRLRSGEIGDNLMYRYRAIASFHLWPEVCRFAVGAAKKLLIEQGINAQIDDFEAFWSDFHRFIELKHAHGKTAREIFTPVQTMLCYDVSRWVRDGTPKNTRPYRLQKDGKFEFRLTDEGARELGDALKVWTGNIIGLTKLVIRIRVASQVRQCHAIAR